MAAAITLERVRELVDQLPAQDQLELVAHISARLSALVPRVLQEGNTAEVAGQQHAQVAHERLAEPDEIAEDVQSERKAAETMKMLLGVRTQPAPDAWLTTVGMIDADDPIMREIDAEGRRIRKSEKPI
jgi:hypothetical protein